MTDTPPTLTMVDDLADTRARLEVAIAAARTLVPVVAEIANVGVAAMAAIAQTQPPWYDIDDELCASLGVDELFRVLGKIADTAIDPGPYRPPS